MKLLERTAYDRLWGQAPAPPAKKKKDVAFWRHEDPVMDGEAVKVGGMWDHQRAFWDLQTFIKLIVTGYGGGKTLILCKRMIALALHNAPVPVALVSPTYGMAKLTTIPTISALLAGKSSLLGSKFQWHPTASPPPTFDVHYRGRDAKILILSGERPRTLKGSNLAAAGIDEPFIQEEDVFKQMVARCRHPQAKRMEIALAGTPEQLNWGYDLCEGDLRKRYDVGLVQASTYANKALSEDYGKRLELGFDERAAQAFVHGQFIDMAVGQVYYNFKRFDHVVDREMPANAELGVGMDFNVNPMAFILFWHTKTDMHVIAEYELPNADTEYACMVVREHPLFGHRVREVYPDASGKARATNAPGGVSDFSILKRYGFHINAHASNPPLRDRYNAANAQLATNDRIRLTINPECTRLIKYLAQYKHELKNKDAQKAMSHLLDAFSYPIAYLWPVVRPSATAVEYGYDPDNGLYLPRHAA